MGKSLFDINKLKQKRESKPSDPKDRAMALKFLKEHHLKVNSIKRLHPLPSPGEIIFLFTERSFNAFTFVPLLVKERGAIDQLTISTYSINKRILLSFMRLVETDCIGKIDLLVADSLKHQRPQVADQLQAFARAHQERLKVQFAWNHSKITLARCGSDHFVIEGSGNWSENARHEQYLFANSEELYGFREKCLRLI